MALEDTSIDAAFVTWLVLGLVLTAGVVLALFRFLGTLVFALFVYYASRPVHRRLDEYTDHPDVGVIVTLLVFVVPILATLFYSGLVLFQEVTAFLAAADLGGLESLLEPYLALGSIGNVEQLLDQFMQNPNQTFDESTRRALESTLGPIQTIADLIFAVLSRLFLLFVFVFYLLRDDWKIADWFRDSVGPDSRVVGFFDRVDEDLEHVFYGNMLTILATGVIAVATYLALDFLTPSGLTLYRPVLLGALVAVGTLVPLVGMKIVYLPFAGLLFLEAAAGAAPLWFPVLFLVATFLIIDTVPDFFVRAFLSAGELNMGLVLLAYVLGAMAFGWYGIFLGPIILVGFVHFAKEVFPALVDRRV